MDISRQALDPAGGTGWVRPSQAAFTGSSSPQPPSPNYACTPGSDGAILYEKPNFDTSGGCWTITASTTSLDGFPGANDNIRSIQIKGRYTVTLYEHPGFSGQPEVFTTHDSDLTANDIGNRTSSVKIEPGGCDPFGEGVTLFAQTNWDGICSTVTSDVSDLSTLVVGSDRTYSVRIRGPYRAELFRDPGFTGLKETILTDEPDLSNNDIGNTASSIRVTRLDCDKEGEGVTLFANRNFDGACATFTANSSDIGPTGLNDSVFSIRIKGPYRAQIYEHPGFSGRDVVQTWEDSDLSNDVYGNGTSSIRVWRYECNPEAEGVILFAQPNYGGICQAFTANDIDIGSDPIGGDDTYSLRINGPYRATLYLDPGLTGTQLVTLNSIPDLRGSAVGNGTSSVRVERTKHDLSVTRLGVAGGSIVASPAGLDCGPTCTFQYDVGSTVTLTAASGGAAEFTGWSGACTGTGPCTLTMDANKAVTATFIQASATVGVTKTGNGTGVVTAAGGGIDCGSDCSESYLVGTVVTLSAVADSGSTFTGWSGPCSGTGPCVVTVDAAKTVTAAFDRPTVATISLLEFSPPSGEGRTDDVVLVHARATSTDPIDAIRLLVDGTPSGEISAAEGTFAWNTNGLATGGHSITVQARLTSAGGSWNGATSRSDTYTLVSAAQASPFDHGNGRDLALTVSGTQVVNVYTTATGSQGSTQLTVGSSSGIAVGDELMIHRTQGANAGPYEFRRVASLSGNTVTLTSALSRDYVGTSQAIRVPNYTTVTVPSGTTMTAQPWNGATGGILVFRATGAVNVQAGGAISVDGLGFRGGQNGNDDNNKQGEGHLGPGGHSGSANGSGGGGGHAGTGGGGGHGAAGGAGCDHGNCFNAEGGIAVGTVDASTMFLGGGGGGAGTNGCGSSPGGAGGGSSTIFAASITVNGTVSARGVAAANACERPGGGGAGGSINLFAEQQTLGNNLVVATGGSGGAGGAGCSSCFGGAGAVGRIRQAFSTSGSGTTNPAANSSQPPPSNQLPVLAVNAGLTVSQGATAEVTEVQLRVTDADSPTGQLTYTIGTAPQRGTLKKGTTTLTGGSTFTQADIDFGLIFYAHTGDDATADSFTFSVSDGEGGSIGTSTFAITVTPPASFALNVTKTGAGTGTVTSSPTGIDCGVDCSESYVSSTVVTLTAGPATGSTFTGWSGACTGTTTCQVTINAVTSVTANFALQGFDLTVTKAGTGTGTVTSSPAGIDCGTDCSENYTNGMSVTLTATPAGGSIFAGWSGGGAPSTCTVTPAPTTCQISVDVAKGVTATFNVAPPSTFSLTVTRAGSGSGTVASQPSGIDCGAICNASFSSGAQVTLTASPAAGSVFAGWSGACTGAGNCTVAMDQARSVTATFDIAPPITHAVTVSKSGSGSGTVTSSPAGIDCGTTCSFSFVSGAQVTLTASAASGSTFGGWSGACTGTSSCQLTVDQAKAVTATFNSVPSTFTLTVTKSGAGSGTVSSQPSGVACGATCSADFTSGTSVTLTAQAASGSTFSGWSGSGCTGTAGCQVTMDQARSVTATFTAAPTGPLSLKVVKAGTGVGTVTSSPAGINCGQDCDQNYTLNTTVTLTAAPASGSTFAGWSGACTNATGTCVVTMNAAKSVTAAFTDPTKPVRISGKVQNAGQPVSNVTVSALCATPSGQACSSVVFDGKTLADGTYVAHGPVGKYDLYILGGDSAGVASSTTTLVDAPADGEYAGKDISVATTVAMSGRVTDADSGAGIGAAKLTITVPRQGATGAVTILTDTAAADGTYATKLALGSYAVTPSKTGYLAQPAAPLTISGPTSGQNITMAPPVNLTVTKAGTGAGTVTRSPVGTSCGTDCWSYAKGTAVIVTATASTGSVFVGWSGGCSGAAASCAQTLDASTQVTATFAPAAKLTVTKTGTGTVTSSPAGINCGSTCTQNYALTSPAIGVTLSATPGSGYVFSGWGGACSGAGSCTVTMDQARTVTATFTVLRTLTVTKNGSGAVTSQPAGVDCGATCTATFPNGTPVTLTATPAAGYAFTGWSGSGCSGTATCTVTMSANRSVTATFKPKFALTVTKAGNGTGSVTSGVAGINCGTDCSEDYASGTSVVLTAAAASGSRFTGWSGACTGTAATCTVSMTTVRSVTATFTSP